MNRAMLVGRGGATAAILVFVVAILIMPVNVTERPDRTFEDLAARYRTVIAVDRDAQQLRLYKNLQLEHTYRIAARQGRQRDDAWPLRDRGEEGQP